jgi:hypothetical protein
LRQSRTQQTPSVESKRVDHIDMYQMHHVDFGDGIASN